MESLVFLVSSFIFSRVIFSKGNFVFFFLRSLGILASVMVVFSLYFSYLSVPLNLYSFSVLFLFLSFLLARLSPEKASFSFRKIFSLEGFCFCDLKTFLFVLAVSLGLSLSYFEFSFHLPKFISVDASVHHYMGKYVLENERLIFTARDLFIKDTDTYPFGTSVVTAVFSRFIPFSSHLEKFQLFNLLLLCLLNAYFLLFIKKYFPFKSKFLFLSLLILIIFGFFFNMMIMGFASQLLGLYLLLFLVDVYKSLDKYGSGLKNIFSAVVLSAILFTYIYWLPIALLFIFFDLVKNIRKVFPAFIIFAALSSPFIFSLCQVNILKFAGSDGLTYKIFLLNFILFIPFILSGFHCLVKELPRRNSGHFFIFSSLTYFLILAALYFTTNSIADYTFAKSFYLIGPLLYFLALYALDKTYAKLPPAHRAILKFSLAVLLVFFVFLPLAKKRENFSEKRKTSLEMDFGGTNGRILDIFYFNAKSIKNSTKEGAKLNLNQKKKNFIENFSAYLGEKNKPQNIAVVADPDTSLWFYSLSWVWPREKIDGSFSVWENGLFDYEKWKKQRKTPYLIILDTKASQEWKERNRFNTDEYTTIYEEGNNYLLKAKDL